LTRVGLRGVGGLRAAAVALLVAGLAAASVPSASASDTSPPSPPGPITVSGLSSTEAVLKWGGSVDDVGVEGYQVYRGPSVASLALIATTDAVASYTATDLRSAYAYAFGVVAIDAAGNRSPMQTVELSTAASSDVTPPAAPSSSSVALKPFSSTRIDVVWAASSSPDVAYYLVFRGGALVGTVERPSSPRFSDNGLAASTSYSYTVQAVDSAGNHSALTTAKTARTLAPGAEAIARGPYLSNVTATSAVVSWWTNIATPGVLTVAGQSITDPAGSVQHHAVTVSGLSAGTNYPYTVTSDAVSASGSLLTAAPPGQAFSFAAIGDFGGQSPGETQNAANIAGAGTQFIQTLGDNIYPAAGLPDPNFTTTYSDFDARFFAPFGPAVKSQAFFPANGNKEYYSDGEFWATFPMPGANHSWYSYDWGDAHILVLDSEQPYAPGSEQYSFAQADLAAHQGDAWRIVVSPRPPYSSTSAASSSQGARQYLVPLFQAEHVDLVLSGNSHNYERTFPLTDGVPVTSGGVTYIVSGGGGNGFNGFGTYTQPWTAFRESSYYEYTKITVTPTSLTADGIRSDTNSIFDTTTIQRAGGGPPANPFVAPPAAPAVTPFIASSVPVSKIVKRGVKRTCVVPRVKGRKLRNARRAVLARGCRVRVGYLVSKRPSGTVLAQSRKAGKKVGFHAVVKLTVAKKARAKGK
jgi:chitodextrinase